MDYTDLVMEGYDYSQAGLISNYQNIVTDNGYPHLLTFTGTTWENYLENRDAEQNIVRKDEGLLGFTTSFDSAISYSIQAYKRGGVDLNGIEGGEPVIMIQRIPLDEIKFGVSKGEPDFDSAKTVEQTSITELAAEEYPVGWIDALAFPRDEINSSKGNIAEFLQEEENWQLEFYGVE